MYVHIGSTAENLFQIELSGHVLHKVLQEHPKNSATGPNGIPALNMNNWCPF